jgi:hypothetical protein
MAAESPATPYAGLSDEGELGKRYCRYCAGPNIGLVPDMSGRYVRSTEGRESLRCERIPLAMGS